MITNPYNERQVLSVTNILAPESLIAEGFIEVSGSYVLHTSHPFSGEYNWPRLSITWQGTGSVSARFVGNEGPISDLSTLNTKIFYSNIPEVVSGQEYHQSIRVNKKVLNNIYLSLTFAGDVSNISVEYHLGDFYSISSGDSLAGHKLYFAEFDGLQVPYRVMLPKNYDNTKTYPVIVSLSGTGGLGQSPEYQAVNMTEWLTLGYAKYVKYYHCDGNISAANPSGKDYQCISILVSNYNDFTSSQYIKDNCTWEGLDYVRSNKSVTPAIDLYDIQNIEDELESKLLNEAKQHYSLLYYLPETIKSILEKIIEEYSVDTDRISYYGFSYGAISYYVVSYLANYFASASLIDTGPQLVIPSSSGNIGKIQYPSEVSAYVHQKYIETKRWCEQVDSIKILRRSTSYFPFLDTIFEYSVLTDESDRILEGSTSIEIIDELLDASESESVYTSGATTMADLHSLHVSQPGKFFTETNMDIIFGTTKQPVVEYPYIRNIGLNPQPDEFWDGGELDYYTTVITEMRNSQPVITKTINKKPISKGVYSDETD